MCEKKIKIFHKDLHSYSYKANKVLIKSEPKIAISIKV